MGARPFDPSRRITADSFRLLMAKLGTHPAVVPSPRPAEILPAPVAEEAPEPPVEEEAVAAEEMPPAPIDAPSEAAPENAYNWSNWLAPAAQPEPPVEDTLERRDEVIEDPVSWAEAPPASQEVETAFDPEPEVEPIETAATEEPERETKPVEIAAVEVPELATDSVEIAAVEETATLEPPLPVITIDLDAALSPVELDQSELVDSLSERLGSSSPLLRRVEPSTDPFARPIPEFEEPRTVDLAEPDHGTEDAARSLLTIMSAPSGASQPQERALAADTLLRLAPRLATRSLMTIAERVSVMENPPPLLVGFLLRHPRNDVARPLLERASQISDLDLMGVIAEGNVGKQRMIARRRAISGALADALIATGEVSVIMNLIRNPGAALSQDAFTRVCALARDYPALQAPLATRPDTPATVAFELFWVASPDLRRLVLSRFLTDSETLSRILKLTLTVDGEGATEAKLPPKQKIEEFIDLLEAGRLEDATHLICEIGSISEATARRILADRQGEPLAVMLKALGLPRGRLSGVLERLQVCTPPRIARERPLAELQAIFDTLSLTKTRVLLTYWDWAGQTTGPHTLAAS